MKHETLHRGIRWGALVFAVVATLAGARIASAAPCLIFVHGKQTNTNTFTNWTRRAQLLEERQPRLRPDGHQELRDVVLRRRLQRHRTPYWDARRGGRGGERDRQRHQRRRRRRRQPLRAHLRPGRHVLGDRPQHGRHRSWTSSSATTTRATRTSTSTAPTIRSAQRISLAITLGGAHRGSQGADAVCGDGNIFCNFIALFIQSCDTATYWLRSSDDVQVRTLLERAGAERLPDRRLRGDLRRQRLPHRRGRRHRAARLAVRLQRQRDGELQQQQRLQQQQQAGVVGLPEPRQRRTRTTTTSATTPTATRAKPIPTGIWTCGGVAVRAEHHGAERDEQRRSSSPFSTDERRRRWPRRMQTSRPRRSSSAPRRRGARRARRAFRAEPSARAPSRARRALAAPSAAGSRRRGARRRRRASAVAAVARRPPARPPSGPRGGLAPGRGLARATAEDYRRRARYPRSSQPLADADDDPIARERRRSRRSRAAARTARSPTLTVYPQRSASRRPSPAILYAYLDRGPPRRRRARDPRHGRDRRTSTPLGDLEYRDDGTDGDAVAGDLVYTAASSTGGRATARRSAPRTSSRSAP